MKDSLALLIQSQEIQLEIAHHLKKQRKEGKLSQSELSDLSGVSLGSLKRFEQTGEISLSSLVKIALVMHLEQDLLHLFES